MPFKQIYSPIRVCFLCFLGACSPLSKEFPSVKTPAFTGISKSLPSDLTHLTHRRQQELFTLDYPQPTKAQDILQNLTTSAKYTLTIESSLPPLPVITFQKHKRALPEMVAALSEKLKLRMEIQDNNTLYVGEDKPYLHTYNLPILSMTRETENKTTVHTNVFQDTKKPSQEGGSSYTIMHSKNTTQWWQDLENNIQFILKTSSSWPSDISPASVLNQDEDIDASPFNEEENSSPITPQYMINKSASSIAVWAKQSEHNKLAAYFRQTQRMLNAQILIEAKIIEVHLKEEYRSGIDWKSVFNGAINFEAPLGSVAKAPTTHGTQTEVTDLVSVAVQGLNMSAFLNLIESFGQVRTLSSPRLTIMNNQNALLKVAENQVFFKVRSDRDFIFATGASPVQQRALYSEIQTVPVGFIMTVQPSIDLVEETITLNLRPTLSRVSGVREDPAVKLMSAELKTPPKHPIRSEIPIIAMREIDSILKLHSGEFAILGGLMQETQSTARSGIPGTDYPILNFFTQGSQKGQDVLELVIILRATIIGADHA